MQGKSHLLSFAMPNCRSGNTMFAVEWLGHKVAIKANNGKYICTKKNGQLVAVSDSIGKEHFSLTFCPFLFCTWLYSHTPVLLTFLRFFLMCFHCFAFSGEDEQFTLKLINRPMLILRGENGFICHHKNSNTLDASRSVYDIFTLQFSNGAYHIQGQDEHT